MVRRGVVAHQVHRRPIFPAGFFIGIVQRFTGQVNTTLSFWLIVLAYVILGLLEVEGSARKIEALVAMLARGETIFPNTPTRLPSTGAAPSARRSRSRSGSRAGTRLRRS